MTADGAAGPAGDEAVEPTDGEEQEVAAGFTIDDPIFQPRAQQRSFRQFPRLVVGAIRLTYEAGPREFVVSGILQVLNGVGVGAQLLIGRDVLRELLSSDRDAGAFGSILPEIVLLLLLTIGLSFAQAIQGEQSRILAELVRRRATDRVLDVAEQVSLGAFESPSFFDRLQRAISNGGSRPYQMVSGVLTILSALVTVAGITVALLALQPLLVPFALLAYAPVWVAMTRNSRSFYEFLYGMTKVDRQRFYLLRVLTGRDEAKEVRAFDLGRFLRRRYDGLYDEHLSGLRRLARMRIRRSVIGSFGTSGLTVVAMGVLGYLYLSGRMTVAAGGAAIAALLQLAGRFQSLVSGAGQLFEATLFLDDYNSFVDLLPEVRAAVPTRRSPPDFRVLEAEHVSFTYPGSTRPALQDVSIRIAAGEVVALVGENGSGKTTLAKLLANLYQPDGGRILRDGEDVAAMDPASVRDSIAVIFQDFIRYLMPARENIGAGRYEAADDHERVVAAARQADADRFLQRLPDGYDTMLGKEFEGGRDLSIGQWQRVALARAFFRNAPFVILDEPTAALDPRAEHDLFDRIRTLLEDRSVLLISHRFSSVRSADRIYVLDGGRVKEHGSHEELMARGGLYAELFTLQAEAYTIPRAGRAQPAADDGSAEEPGEHVGAADAAGEGA